jgi:hypothetical protein
MESESDNIQGKQSYLNLEEVIMLKYVSRVALLIGLGFCCLTLPSYAAVPNVFVNGVVADATLVNQNFNYLENKFSTTSGHNHDGVTSKVITQVMVTSAYGGTGNNNASAPQGSILYAQSTGDFVALSPGTSGQILISNGTFANPSWSNNIPSGVIVMWSGTIATIPTGWLLCDGTSGTPNLVDRFIVGAKQDDGGVAKTNIEGSLTQTGGVVTATTSAPSALEYVAFTGVNVANSVHTHTVSTLSPYYALAFIMKS